jgi:hypothetical protein
LKARNDANHREITAALRRCGWQICNIRYPADLMITKPGRNILLVEIKRDANAKFTKAQLDIQARGFKLFRIETLEDVVRLTQLPDARSEIAQPSLKRDDSGSRTRR